MDAAERFDQLFAAYRRAENERIVAWAAVYRKLASIAHGSASVTPSAEELEELREAKERSAAAEHAMLDLMAKEFGVEVSHRTTRELSPVSKGLGGAHTS